LIYSIKKELIEFPERVISICVFLVYWLVNRSYTGPSVLDDEIGYLANAALISGHIIDGASQYHSGYSFFLAPLFHIFSEPSHIWQAAMVFNAFLWAVSFLLLAWILKKLMPDLDKRKLTITLLLSAAYPTWITMAGYTFATTAFVFVYLLSILSLLFWNPDKYWSIIPHCILVGYLFWIHPVGLAVAMASFIVVGFVCIREKKYPSVLLSMIIIASLIVINREVFDPWLTEISTPEGYTPLSSYPDSEDIFSKMLSSGFWLQFIAKFAGQISYLLVSSFGLVCFGFINSINKSYRLIQGVDESNGCKRDPVNQSTYAYLILSLLGVLAMGVILFSGNESRIDHWIYGRYSEMVVLPLLAIGYLSLWHKKRLLFAALFIIGTGLILNQVADDSASKLFVNIVAFWPQYIVLEANYLYWMVLGTLALILIGTIKNYSKLANELVAAFLIIFFIFSTIVQGIIHQGRLSTFGKPSAFLEIIRDNYSSGTCVGFNTEDFDCMHELKTYRYNLYLFHLYDYGYRRMKPEEWLKSCDGPYFTYQLDELYKKQGVNLVGKEVSSGLYLLTKEEGFNINNLDLPKSNIDIYKATEWALDYKTKYEGDYLAKLSGPGGYYKDGSIYSTGDGGFILLDPGKKLGPGKYNFALLGDAIEVDGSWVDIVTKSGETELARFDIRGNSGAGKGVIASGTFLLDDPVVNLEVRVHGYADENIRIDGYEIEYINEDVE